MRRNRLPRRAGFRPRRLWAVGCGPENPGIFSSRNFWPKKSWLRMSIWNNNFPISVRGFLPRKIFPGKRKYISCFTSILRLGRALCGPPWQLRMLKKRRRILFYLPILCEFRSTAFYTVPGPQGQDPSPPCGPVFSVCLTGAEMLDLGCFQHAFLESDAGKLEKSLSAVISEVPI